MAARLPHYWRKSFKWSAIGLGLVAGFLVIVLAFVGISALPAGAPAYGNYGLFVSWGMVCVSTVILFLTANQWASTGIGFFCVPAVFKSIAVLLFGTSPLGARLDLVKYESEGFARHDASMHRGDLLFRIAQRLGKFPKSSRTESAHGYEGVALCRDIAR